jgi:serine-type D-Ala-D-Ala carboxypeptidase/endopeptidase
MTVTKRRVAILIASASLICPLGGAIGAQPTSASAGELDAAAVRAALIPRVNDGTFRGIATAWLKGDSLRTASAGVTAAGGSPIDPSTIFDLGELGALLNAALLANLVSRGELSFDDLAQRFLPAPLRLPTRSGRAITLGDLVFQRSGLPARSGGGAIGASNVDRLDNALRGVTLTHEIGSRYTFSELGNELLGVALERHLGIQIEAAVKERLLAPLDITDFVYGSERLNTKVVATGHAAAGAPISPEQNRRPTWHGSLLGVSRFAVAAADTITGPLARTFALMMRTRSIGPESALPVALGWRVLRLQGRDIYWHDAQDARGFSAFVAVDPSRKHASAVLSNSARAVDAIAGQLLLGSVPIIDTAPPSTQRTPAPRVAEPRSSRVSQPRRRSAVRRATAARGTKKLPRRSRP